MKKRAKWAQFEGCELAASSSGGPARPHSHSHSHSRTEEGDTRATRYTLRRPLLPLGLPLLRASEVAPSCWRVSANFPLTTHRAEHREAELGEEREGRPSFC